MNEAGSLPVHPSRRLPAGQLAALLLLVGLLLAAYAPTLSWLWLRYQATGTYYAHGPLVPLVTAALLWWRRRQLEEAPAGGSWWGLALVVPAVLLHLLAALLQYDSISGFSLLLLLPGLVLLLAGAARLRVAAFPLGFLAFAVPLPMILVVRIATWLKLAVLKMAAVALDLAGTGVAVEGSFLVLPAGDRLLVDEECCGLRSLVALLALGVLMAGTSRRLGTVGRLGLVASALPVAMFANFLRVITLCVVGLVGGADAARAAHDATGYVVYAVALGAYVALERLPFWSAGDARGER